MDFFAHENKVRRGSRRLVVLFALGVAGIIAEVDVVVVLAFGLHHARGAEPGQPVGFTVDWPTIGLVSLAVLVLIVLASMYRMASLRGGGAVVAQSMGATPVPADTTNPAWQQLRNVIEEIAIAAGVPVPDIFIMEREDGINAFAAGYTPSDAAVCVTQGCLDRLTRDELQGVIAHEFSHVLNGDMRLNIRLMGLLFGILVIGIVGRFIMYSGVFSGGGRSRSRGGGNTAYIALIGIAVVIIGAVGFFFGRLIQAAVSRSRESLADASAVQFTRQTAGIAGALKKIAALEVGSQLAAHNKHEVAHMLFGEPGRFSSLFATHPPLPRRLKDLGVEWDEKEIEQLARAWDQPRRAAGHAHASASVSGLAPTGAAAMAGTPAPHPAMPGAGSAWHVPTSGASGRVGQPGTADFDLAGVLRKQLPAELAAATRDAAKARALLLALTMDHDPGIRDAQLLTIDHTLGSEYAEDAEALLKPLAKLHPMQRLPLAALVFPTLRRRPRPELEKLLDTLEQLVHADRRVDLHEYCLMRVLHLQLRDLLNPSSGFRPGRHRLRQCRESFAALCAIVAAHGNRDEAKARQAFGQAWQRTLPGDEVDYAVPEDWQDAMDKALTSLDTLRAPDKQLLVDGIATAISADGVVTVDEAELLRVICAALHCPLPLLHAQPETPA
jgi:Zn-dependent protease with chaperone function